MKLKYIPVFATDFNVQIDFYTQKLGLEITGTLIFYEGKESTVIQSNNLNVALLLTCGEVDAGFKNSIILNTADCLKDYHQLKKAGVFFCTEPQYLPAGLAAEFKDPAGNRFTLLEERIYNQQ